MSPEAEFGQLAIYLYSSAIFYTLYVSALFLHYVAHGSQFFSLSTCLWDVRARLKHLVVSCLVAFCAYPGPYVYIAIANLKVIPGPAYNQLVFLEAYHLGGSRLFQTSWNNINCFLLSHPHCVASHHSVIRVRSPTECMKLTGQQT